VLRDGESFNAYLDEFRIDEAAADAGVQLTHLAFSDAEGDEYTALYPPPSRTVSTGSDSGITVSP
jgi:hypothetical protein